jgi:hypothetical protein
LLGVFEGAQVVAVGGLNRDADAPDKQRVEFATFMCGPCGAVGGLATALMGKLLRRGSLAFVRLRLRTDNPAAGRFYEGLGFLPTEEPSATHLWLPSASLRDRLRGPS